MPLINSVLMQTLPSDTISDSQAGSDTLLIRAGIFLVCLLIFVFACGFAWRKVPALRALIPAFKPGESSLEARLREKRERQEAEALQRAAAVQANPTTVAPPNLSKRPLTSQPQITLAHVSKSEAQALPLASELYSSDKRIEAALADGTPGALVHSASDLDGSIHHAPIMIVQRGDDEPTVS